MQIWILATADDDEVSVQAFANKATLLAYLVNDHEYLEPEDLERLLEDRETMNLDGGGTMRADEIEVLSYGGTIEEPTRSRHRARAQMRKQTDPRVEDVASALIHLGFKRPDAMAAADMAITATPNAEVDDLVKAALKSLAKK